MKITKGWKNLNKNLTCKSFQFKIGKIEKHIGPISMCDVGFHFYTNPANLFQFYSQDCSIVAEIEASGEIIHEANKSVCSEITIIKILTKEELKILGNQLNNTGWGNTGRKNIGNRNIGCKNIGDKNSGDYNSGDCNIGNWNTGGDNIGDYNTGYKNTGKDNSGGKNLGDWNTGDWNIGHRNSGYRNIGNCNSGDWNKSNRLTGFFNSEEPEEILVFNKLCNEDLWRKAIKPDFIYFKESWNEILYNLTKEDIQILQQLPNFDDSVFKEISGFSVADLIRYEVLFQKFKKIELLELQVN